MKASSISSICVILFLQILYYALLNASVQMDGIPSLLPEWRGR